MKKLLFKIVYFIPLLVLFFLINYCANNLKVLNKTEYSIATALVEHKNVAFESDFNDRLVQKFYIEKIKSTPEIVVLGSSRSQKIDKDFFHDKSFFNNSVTGARLEDYLGVYELYDKRGTVPAMIIIGVDPWAFNQDDTSYRWLTLKREVRRLSNRLPNQELPTSYIRSAFSIPFLQFSLRQISKNAFFGREGSKYMITTESQGFLPTIRSDGSIADSQKVQSKTAEEIENEILNMMEVCPADIIEGKLSREKQEMFLNFISYLQNKGIEVVFWLPPFHPIAYTGIETHESCVWALEVEDYIRQWAEERNIQIVGSYNPQVYDLTSEDFYDAIHPKREAVESMFVKDLLLK